MVLLRANHLSGRLVRPRPLVAKKSPAQVQKSQPSQRRRATSRSQPKSRISAQEAQRIRELTLESAEIIDPQQAHTDEGLRLVRNATPLSAASGMNRRGALLSSGLSLRDAMVIKEILDPPMALREPNE